MTTPVGLLSKPLTDMRKLISESDGFQAWVGASTAAEALAYVHLFEDEYERFQHERFAFVTWGNPLKFERAATGSGLAAYEWSNSSHFGFVEMVDDYNDDNVIDFLNNIHTFINEILTLQSGVGQKSIDRLMQIPDNEFPLRIDQGVRAYQIMFLEMQST